MKEEAAAADAESSDTITKIEEFMLCGEDANANMNPRTKDEQPVYESVVYPFRSTTTKTLQDIAREMGLQYTGTKKVLWDRITRSGHVGIVRTAKDGQSFTFRRLKATEGSVPSWIILALEPVPPVAGIDMTTGAQLGFFGPTNPTNSVGATRSNILHGR